MKQVEELSQIINLFCSKYKKTQNEILTTLEKVCGNVEDLNEVLENNNNKIEWNDIDDEILLEANPQNMEGLKMIAKYKGWERIKKRIEFKGFEVQFQI